MENIKILIVESFQELIRNIIDIFSNVEYIKIVGVAETIEETFKKLEEKSIDVIIIGADFYGNGYKVTEKITSDYPETAVVIIEEKFKADTVHKAIFSGAKDVLVYPFNPSQLVDTVYRSYKLNKKPVHNKEGYPQPQKQAYSGNVISVFSTKGGVGKTFIAVNLAIALQKLGKRTALVDLDLDFGHVALALNIEPKFTITDIVDDLKNIDNDVIESYLTTHESGITVLPVNANLNISEFINAEHIDKILKTLQKSFDYIIVDMPARFYKNITPAFINTDHLFMVTTPEISSIRNVKSALITLNNYNYGKSKIKLILNCANPKGIIKPKDIEATLNQNIYATIHYDYKNTITSLNEGIPAVQKNDKRGIGKEFMNLANALLQN